MLCASMGLLLSSRGSRETVPSSSVRMIVVNQEMVLPSEELIEHGRRGTVPRVATGRGRTPQAGRSPSAHRGRRSPAPEDRQRDAARTRQALLDAALAEFAANGLDG